MWWWWWGCAHSRVSDTTLGGGQGPVPCVWCWVLGPGCPPRLDHWSVVPSPDLELALNIPQTLARPLHWPGPGSYVGTASNSTGQIYYGITTAVMPTATYIQVTGSVTFVSVMSHHSFPCSLPDQILTRCQQTINR